MRRAYSADVTVIDDAVGRIVAALDARGLLDNTWIIYTSDHGEMGGNHGLMSKCVLYEPAVRVPLIVRPPGGCAPRVVDGLVEHLDVPATLRDIAAAPALAASEGRSLLGYVDGDDAPSRRARCRSARTGASPSFETDRYKLVVDEDALRAVPALRPRRRSRTRTTTASADPEYKRGRRRADGHPRAPVPRDRAGPPPPQPVHRLSNAGFGDEWRPWRSPIGAGTLSHSVAGTLHDATMWLAPASTANQCARRTRTDARGVVVPSPRLPLLSHNTELARADARVELLDSRRPLRRSLGWRQFTAEVPCGWSMPSWPRPSWRGCLAPQHESAPPPIASHACWPPGSRWPISIAADGRRERVVDGAVAAISLSPL